MRYIQTCLKFIVFVVVLGIYQSAFAGHILGGEINYECIGNDSFLVKVEMFFEPDALSDVLGTGNADDWASLVLFENDGANLEGSESVHTIYLSDTTTIKTEVNNVCYTNPESKSIKKFTYSGYLVIPPSTNGYTLTYFRCCRAETNFENISSDEGLSLSAIIPASNILSGACNSTPVFDNAFPRFVCINSEFSFDMSCTDVDGDSLVYSIVAPKDGGTSLELRQDSNVTPYWYPPFEDIVYGNGFDGENPFGNSVIVIDSATGIITGTADAVGDYFVAVQVTEYRNGVLLGSRIRDCAVVVDPCSNFLDPKPIDVNLTTKNTSCGLSVTFGNEGQNGDTFAWDFGDPAILTDVSTLENPTWIYDDYGQYTVTLNASIAGNDCDTTVSLVLDVVPGVIHSDFVFYAACDTDVVIFNSKATSDSTPIVSYIWDFGDGSALGAGDSIEHVYISNASFNVIHTVTDTNLCTDDTAIIAKLSQSILADFKVADGGNDSTACSKFVQFDDLSIGHEIDSNRWHFGEVGDADSSFVENPSWDFSAIGAYNVSLIVKGNCGSDTLTRSITVAAIDSVNFAIDPKACDEDTVVLRAFAYPSENNIKFTWDFGVVLGIGNEGKVISDLTYPTAAYYDIFVVGTDTVSGCSSNSNDTAHYNYLPAMIVTKLVDDDTDSSYSCNLSMTFDNPLPGGGNTFSWDFGTDATPATSTAIKPNVTFGSVGKKIISYTVTNFTVNPNCNLTFEDTLYVYQVGDADFAYDTTQLCTEPRLTVTDSSVAGLDIDGSPVSHLIQWVHGSSSVANPYHIEKPFVSEGYINSLTLTIQNVFNSEKGHVCSNEEIKNDIPWSEPMELAFDADWQPGTNATYCDLEIEFNNASIGGSHTTEWFFGDGSSETNDFDNPTKTYQNPGVYPVKLRLTNEYTGCLDSVIINVTIATPPVADFSYDEFCENFTFMINDKSEAGYGAITSWAYYLGDPDDPDTRNTASYEYEFADTGLNTVQLDIIDEYGCTSTVTKNDVNYYIIPSPVFSIIGYDISADGVAYDTSSGINIYEGDSIVAYIADTGSLDDFMWDFGDESDKDSTDKKPTHHYFEEGTYTVSLTANNSTGCTGTLEQIIEVAHRDMVRVPTVFTPNGDGSNGILNFRTLGLKDFRISIYNRWGSVVFTTDDPLNQGWDGRNISSKKEVPAGTYIWVVEALDANDSDSTPGVRDQKFGEIILVR